MKKLFCLTFTTLLLAACGGGSKGSSENNPVAPAKPKYNKLQPDQMESTMEVALEAVELFNSINADNDVLNLNNDLRVTDVTDLIESQCIFVTSETHNNNSTISRTESRDNPHYGTCPLSFNAKSKAVISSQSPNSFTAGGSSSMRLEITGSELARLVQTQSFKQKSKQRLKFSFSQTRQNMSASMGGTGKLVLKSHPRPLNTRFSADLNTSIRTDHNDNIIGQNMSLKYWAAVEMPFGWTVLEVSLTAKNDNEPNVSATLNGEKIELDDTPMPPSLSNLLKQSQVKAITLQEL